MLLWQLLAGVPYIIAFASRSKKNYDVAEASLQISWCFYVAALYNLGFSICSLYIKQVWSPLL